LKTKEYSLSWLGPAAQASIQNNSDLCQGWTVDLEGPLAGANLGAKKPAV
jgi:hypothetical protein